MGHRRNFEEIQAKFTKLIRWGAIDEASAFVAKEQRDDFLREFKAYLAVSYGDRIDRYEQEEVEIVGEREEPRGDVMVRTRIVGGRVRRNHLRIPQKGSIGRKNANGTNNRVGIIVSQFTLSLAF